MNFIVAKTRAQVAFCKDALFAFRTNLDETNYIDLVMNMIANERFKLVYIPDDDNMKAAAFIGYRVMYTLRTSWMIYVDHEATEARIQSVHLDSGYMLHDAHRLYLNKGYVLACNHFAKRISLSV